MISTQRMGQQISVGILHSRKILENGGLAPTSLVKFPCSFVLVLSVSLLVFNAILLFNANSWNYYAANECCERLAYYGMSTNLVNYMKIRLNQGNATAANNVTNWSGTCYIMPLVGAFIADAYWGRYWTIASFMIVYIFVGITKIIVQLFTYVSSLHELK